MQEYQFTHQDKIDIIKRIDNLSFRKKKKYYINLFNIINNSNTKYTNNLNGIFFNLNNLDNDTIIKIKIFLDNIENNLDSESETNTTTDN